MKFLLKNILFGFVLNSLNANPDLPIYTKYFNGQIFGAPIVTDATENSSVRNREFIGEVLSKYIEGDETVFEVGTGTADQSVYFCEKFPTIIWQTSDQECYFPEIIAKLQKSNIPSTRLKPPVAFDIDKDDLEGNYSIIYSSNVVHCIPWESTESLFKKASLALKINVFFILYGPYNINGYTSDGNKTFDAKLRPCCTIALTNDRF